MVTTVVRALNNLAYASDPITNQVVYNFSKINELATPIRRPTLQYRVPGTNIPYDPLGLDPNWIDMTTLRVKFYHAYVGAETFYSVKDALWQALGNKAVVLFIVENNNVIKRNVAKLVDRPNDETTVQKLDYCEFDLTFQLASPFWKGPPDPTALFYDNNQKYDVGLAYDQLGETVICSGTSPWTLNVTNNGNAPDFESSFNIIGPLAGPIIISNTAIPLSAGYMRLVYGYNPATNTYKNLASGDVLTINIGIAQVLLNGNPDLAFFTWGLQGSGQREWMILNPGANPLVIDNNGGTSGGSVTCNSLDTYVV